MATMWMRDAAASVADFVNKIKKIPAPKDGFYCYRGEADVDWPLAPGIMRAGREKLLENEKDAVRELISVHPNEFVHDSTMFDRLVRMQHFNLPTRLLDVSANPLVGLFNAVDDGGLPSRAKDGHVYYISVANVRKKFYDSDTVSCVSNLANLSALGKRELLSNIDKSVNDFNDPHIVPATDRLLQFVKAEKPFFRPVVRAPDLNDVWYVVPKLSNRRIIAQNGAFLIFGLGLRLNNPKSVGQLEIASISIPCTKKEEIRRDLMLLGITRSYLFPEIDKAAENIRQKYE